VEKDSAFATTYAYTPASRLSNLTHNLEGAGTAHDANWAFAYNVAGQMAQRSLAPVYERVVPAPLPVSTPPQSPYLVAMYDLYHPRIFELAAEIPHIGRLPAPQGSAMRHSRVCGSTVTVDVRMEADKVADFALEVEACALGQASAAVLARAAIGATRDEIAQALDALEAMLKQDGAPPSGRFWELRHLEGVREYPARHISVMLAWRAALAAIDAANPDQAGATAARTSA
jgi:NifU-like protein involved in Fe-S cluster formation